MKSGSRSNLLAALLLLLGCAGFTWYASRARPSEPSQRVFTPAPSTGFEKGKPTVEGVVVKVLDKPLRCKASELDSFLFGEFANTPDEEKFKSYTSVNWKANFDAFSASLVRKAVERQLDSASLGKVLELVLKDSEDLAYLPVGAYQATLNDEPVWIVTVKWESVEMGKGGLGHIRVFAFHRRTLKQVGFVTCG